MAKEKQGAMYMAREEDNLAKLVHGEDVEQFTADGYQVLSGKRGDNGEDWNREEDQGARDLAADFAKTAAKLASEKAEKEAKASEDARKASEKAAADAEKKK